MYLCKGRPATQVSTFKSFAPTNAVDGDYDNLQHTSTDLNPWVQIDLEMLRYVSGVKVWNRPSTPIASEQLPP